MTAVVLLAAVIVALTVGYQLGWLRATTYSSRRRWQEARKRRRARYLLRVYHPSEN